MAYQAGSPYQLPWWMQQQQGPTPQSEMPTGQLVRDPSTMGTAALQHELMSLQSPYGRYGGRVPAFMAGGFSGLGGIPGLGFALGGMAQAGMQNRMGTLGRENTQRQITQQYPGGGMPSFAPPPAPIAPVGFMQAVDQAIQSGSDSDRGYGGGRDSYQGGEVGAGGWAGGGGL